MYTPNQNQPPKPPQMLGRIQESYTYRLSQFVGNDQITIVEDMPKNRPVREMKKTSAKGNAYTVYLIRIDSNGFEADLEMFGHELMQIAIACPKATENFKGVTLVHNGRAFVYLSTAYPLDPSVPPRDTRQPNLDPVEPVDQVKKNIGTMVADMIKMYAVNSPGYIIDIKTLTNVANSILPGKALDLISAAKAQGYIIEHAGKYTPT